jgi:hypothetical protein
MRARTGRLLVVAAALLVSACTSSGGKKSDAGSFEARPVIMPALHVTHVRPDPFGSLHVPADENAYSALSRSRQAALADALRSVDCAHPPTLSGIAVRVVCDQQSYAYLLGAPLFTAHDVKSAIPIAPGDVFVQWRIALSLNSAGGDSMWNWTSQHHTNFPDGEYTVTQMSSKPPCGATVKTPCSDFLAYIDDGVVVTVPVTSDPFRTSVLVSGEFTKASAARLAHKLSG